jgi:hypothetical protein
LFKGCSLLHFLNVITLEHITDSKKEETIEPLRYIYTEDMYRTFTEHLFGTFCSGQVYDFFHTSWRRSVYIQEQLSSRHVIRWSSYVSVLCCLCSNLWSRKGRRKCRRWARTLDARRAIAGTLSYTCIWQLILRNITLCRGTLFQTTQDMYRTRLLYKKSPMLMHH